MIRKKRSVRVWGDIDTWLDAMAERKYGGCYSTAVNMLLYEMMVLMRRKK